MTTHLPYPIPIPDRQIVCREHVFGILRDGIRPVITRGRRGRSSPGIYMAQMILFRPRFHYLSGGNPPVPWGPLYIGSALSHKGYSIQLIDEFLDPGWRQFLPEMLQKRPICVGVSAMTGSQIDYGLSLSRFVKRHDPQIPVVWGGVHASLFPRQTLAEDAVDCVVVGEGEETIVETVQCLEQHKSLASVKGIGFKQNGHVYLNPLRLPPDLNSLPRIDYSLIDVNAYLGKRFGAERSFELCTSRGCPHSCRFCYNARFSRHTWRSLSVELIFSYLHEVIAKFNVDAVTWREDNFFVDQQRVKEIAHRIIREGIRIYWHADCRIDYLDRYDDNFIELLKKSGCHTLTLGAESGSDRMLHRICKGITRKQILSVSEKLSRYGIYQNYHFMLGMPGENREDVMQTLTLIDLLRRGNRFFGRICGPSLYTPYPGTEMYDDCKKMGIVIPESLAGWSGMDWYSCHLSWISRKERKRIEALAWTILGMGVRGFGVYCKLKFFLFLRFNLWIPGFERVLFKRLIKLKQWLRVRT